MMTARNSMGLTAFEKFLGFYDFPSRNCLYLSDQTIIVIEEMLVLLLVPHTHFHPCRMMERFLICIPSAFPASHTVRTHLLGKQIAVKKEYSLCNTQDSNTNSGVLFFILFCVVSVVLLCL